jgi:hypothetical protein
VTARRPAVTPFAIRWRTRGVHEWRHVDINNSATDISCATHAARAKSRRDP